MNSSFPEQAGDFAELAAMYAAEMPARMDALEYAFASCDREQLTRLLHQLVGSAGSYGFDALSVDARKVELALRNGAPFSDVAAGVRGVINFCRKM